VRGYPRALEIFGRPSGPVVVGHRGGRGEGWPIENTLAAFERARAQGAHAIELDVRLTADDEVVVIHDPTLARITRGRDTRAVATLSAGELSRIELAGGAIVPRLADVLAWAGPARLPVNVEIKHDVPKRLALVRAVARELAWSSTPVLVSSFDPASLLAMRLLSHKTVCALLTDPSQTYARALFLAARPPFVLALHVERRQADPKRIARWKKRGLAVGVWTVNDADEAARLVEAGVDILITDEPARILAAVS
jgi:glycerophosphoryl diester phosphodiesterase